MDKGVILLIALLCGVPIGIVVGWHIYQFTILPAFIPAKEIERLARELYAKNPKDPHQAAYFEEHTAWHRGEAFEQGKWRRVRRYLKKRARTAKVDSALKRIGLR